MMSYSLILPVVLLAVAAMCSAGTTTRDEKRNHLSLTHIADSAIESDKKLLDDTPKPLAPGDRLLKLNINQHQPCSSVASGNENIKIVFPSNDQSELKSVYGELGCYTISGRVLVKEDIDAEMQVFVNQTHGVDQHLPNRCKDADKRGCGGTGSCAYCAKCEDLDTNEDLIQRQSVKLIIDNEEPKCGDTLKKGFHNNVALKFCLPTRNEWLEANGYESSTMSKMLDALDSQNVMLSMKVFIYDFDISATQRSSLLLINLQAAQKVDPKQYMSSAAYNALSMTQMLKSNQHIGCHVVVGHLSLE